MDEGQRVERVQLPLDGRIVNDCRLKCPLRSGPRQAPMAGLTNGSRNLHSLRSIRLPISPESRARPFVPCSFYHELHGRNKKKREREEVAKEK